MHHTAGNEITDRLQTTLPVLDRLLLILLKVLYDIRLLVVAIDRNDQGLIQSRFHPLLASHIDVPRASNVLHAKVWKEAKLPETVVVLGHT